MENVLANLFAAVVTVPVLGWIVVYWITLSWTGYKKRAFRLAADVTTILLMFSVYYIAREIWHVSFLWLILIVIFGSAILFSVLQWKTSEDLYLKKIIKGTWRFNFLLFAMAYIVLSFYGIVNTLVTV